MKYIFLIFILLLLIVSCNPDEISSEDPVEAKEVFSNEEILEKYPDNLDTALEELELIDE
jgi:hypothetical protein